MIAHVLSIVFGVMFSVFVGYDLARSSGLLPKRDRR